MNEIEKLKDEIKSLKQKYKNKCEKLKKANEKVLEIKNLGINTALHNQINYMRNKIFEELTNHLNVFTYNIRYQFEKKIYSENYVKSFGSKWLEESLCIHLARERKIIVYSYEIKILNVTKLW